MNNNEKSSIRYLLDLLVEQNEREKNRRMQLVADRHERSMEDWERQEVRRINSGLNF